MAALCTKQSHKPCTCQLPNNSSTYTAVAGYSFGSQTYLLFQGRIVFDIVHLSVIFTVSISLKLWSSNLSSDFGIIYGSDKRWEEIVFVWVPGHVGIKGMEALAGDIRVEFIPFSDLNSCINKYILELWQSEWDEFPGNKLHKIFPVLKECIVCPRTNRKEETVVARWPFFYYSFLFILRSHQCALDVMNF